MQLMNICDAWEGLLLSVCLQSIPLMTNSPGLESLPMSYPALTHDERGGA